MKNELLKVAHNYLYDLGIVHDYALDRLMISRDSIMNNKMVAMMHEEAVYQYIVEQLTKTIIYPGKDYRYVQAGKNDNFIFIDIIGKGL